MGQREGVYVNWVARLFPHQGKWTEEDYFSLPDTNMIIELSDGEITMAPPPTPVHQRYLRRLVSPLENFVEENQLGEVFRSPVAVRLWEGKIRQPDALFLKMEHLDQITGSHIEGAPDWVCEIISPRSRKIDSEEKLEEYAKAGIPEYWLLDSKTKTIRVYILEGNRYLLDASYGMGDIAKSVTIAGFEIAVSEVFRV